MKYGLKGWRALRRRMRKKWRVRMRERTSGHRMQLPMHFIMNPA